MINAKEAKSIATELMNEFDVLHNTARHRWSIARGRHGKSSTESSSTGPTIEQALKDLGLNYRIPIVSRGIEDAARTVVGSLAQPEYQIHIEPHMDKWNAKADKLEVHDANLLLRLNHVMVRNAVHRHQAVSPFAPVVIRQKKYSIPERKPNEKSQDYLDRVERYQHEYTAFEVGVDDPTGWAFVEDGNLNCTTVVGKYEKAVIDFARDYGQYDKKGETNSTQMLELFEEQFPTLRAGHSMSEDTNTWQGKKIKICVIDDGVTITHYVEMPGGGYYDDFENSWPNPFGIPTMLPIPGVFDQSASSPEDRYTPWLLPLMQSRWNLDLQRSIFMSKAAAPDIHTAPVAPAVQERLVDMDPAMAQRYLEQLSKYAPDRINPTFGTVGTLNQTVSDYEAESLRMMEQEHAQYLPHSAFSGAEGSQNLIRNAPTSTLLRLDELEGMKFAAMHQLWVNHGLLKIFTMHDAYWRENEHGPNKPGRKGDEYSYAVTTGAERRRDKSVASGDKLQLGPDDFEFGYDRYIDQVDRRVSSIARNIDVMNLRTNINGKTFITDEEVLTGLGIADATEYLVKTRAETRYKRIFQAVDALSMAAAVQRQAAMTGIDVTPYLVNASGAPGQGASPGDPGSTTPPAAASRGVTVNPPAPMTTPISGATV